MGYAFGISEEDIIAVAERNGVEIEFDVAEKWMLLLNLRQVEQAALMGSGLDDQTEGAYLEIERQLGEMGFWGKKYAEIDAKSLDNQTPDVASPSPRRRI